MQKSGTAGFLVWSFVVTVGWFLLMVHCALVSAMVLFLSGIILISSVQLGRFVAQDDLLLLLVLVGAILGALRYVLGFSAPQHGANILTKPELILPLWLMTLGLAFRRWQHEKQS